MTGVSNCSESSKPSFVNSLEHHDLGGLRVVAGVLLVLGGEHAGVVRDRDDQPAVDAGIGDGEERVGSHVQADMFLRAERAAAGDGGADRGLHGDFFIGGPFTPDVVAVPDSVLGDLGTGRPGITGDQTAAGFIESAGHCLVSK